MRFKVSSAVNIKIKVMDVIRLENSTNQNWFVYTNTYLIMRIYRPKINSSCD